MSLDLKHEWILKQTSFVLLYPFDMSCLPAFVYRHCTMNKKPFVLERDKKKTMKELRSLWLAHWAIHHIYQDIQKGPVLTLIFNGILTWTCRLIYDTLVRTGSIIQIFLYFSSITLYMFMFIHKYAIRYRLFGVTTDI